MIEDPFAGIGRPIDRFDEVLNGQGQAETKKAMVKTWIDWEYLPGRAIQAIKNYFKKEK